MVCANPGCDFPPSHEHKPASIIEAADRRGIRGLYFSCPPPPGGSSVSQRRVGVSASGLKGVRTCMNERQASALGPRGCQRPLTSCVVC